MDLTILYIIVFLLSLTQSIAGVGVLVLGTPILLIYNFAMLDIMFFLLPISVTTSLLNITLLGYFYNYTKKVNLNLIKYFFIFCIPSILIGIFMLKKFSNEINFNILVSLIIFISIFLKIKFNNNDTLTKKSKKIFTIVMGFVHGLTNSGGTLLSLFLLRNNKQNNNLTKSTFEIHFFYALLAGTQFLILILLDENRNKIDTDIVTLIILILLSTIFGNLISNKIKKITELSIYILAILSALFLLKNFFII